MVVMRFRVQCKPDRIGQTNAAFTAMLAPSRAVAGAISFDIGQDILDPTGFIATEVIEDQAALVRQEAFPETETTVGLLPDLLTAEREATIFHVALSEPWWRSPIPRLGLSTAPEGTTARG